MNKELIDILKHIQKFGYIQLKALEGLSLEDRELIKNLKSKGLIDEALLFAESANTQEEWLMLRHKLKYKPKGVNFNLRNTFKYAAIIVVLFGLFLFVTRNEGELSDTIVDADGIELILENGTVKKLSASDSKTLTLVNGMVIGNQSGNLLNYAKQEGINELVYNQIKIPNGKRFNLTLSDGTSVHLNAGSSLKYPVNFINGQLREVYLEGEAYFDVAKDKSHPFIVHAEEVNIKVLGTSFNVSSYKEDSKVNTVLVEGAVQLYDAHTPENTTLLEPGFKATMDKVNGDIALSEVDTEVYTGWMTGDVVFRNTPFPKMIAALERSYGVTIENKNSDLEAVNFNASFNVNIERIEDILAALSEMKSFNYSIINKNILIH